MVLRGGGLVLFCVALAGCLPEQLVVSPDLPPAPGNGHFTLYLDGARVGDGSLPLSGSSAENGEVLLANAEDRVVTFVTRAVFETEGPGIAIDPDAQVLLAGGDPLDDTFFGELSLRVTEREAFTAEDGRPAHRVRGSFRAVEMCNALGVCLEADGRFYFDDLPPPVSQAAE